VNGQGEDEISEEDKQSGKQKPDKIQAQTVITGKPGILINGVIK